MYIYVYLSSRNLERKREREIQEEFCLHDCERSLLRREFCESFVKAEILVKFFKGVSDEISSLRVERVSLDGIRFRNCSEDFSFVIELYRDFYDFS